jgi:hypothetical protein
LFQAVLFKELEILFSSLFLSFEECLSYNISKAALSIEDVLKKGAGFGCFVGSWFSNFVLLQ